MRSTVKSKSIFLPVTAKYIGGCIVLLTTVSAVFIRERNHEMLQQLFWLKPILKCLILFGFMVMIFSKEKIEDEFIMHKRLQAFLFAFIFGMVQYMGNIFLKELAGKLNDSAFSILCCQSTMYLFRFHSLKNN